MGRATSALKSWHWDGISITPFRGGVPISDRGFRYGQHLFESIAVRNGRTLLPVEHIELLAASAGRLGIPSPRPLFAALRRFVDSVSLPDGMLRIYLTAGEGAPASPVRNPACYLAWESTPFPTLVAIRKGIALKLLKKRFPGEGWREKSGNYASHIAALEAARSVGADEAVVTDATGRILSCAMGNLLLWLPCARGGGNILHTPSSGCGPRAGAVLGWVRRHTAVKDSILRGTHLRRAVALAVSNSRLGVMPVATLDGRPLPEPSLALALADAYLLRHGLFRST
jgi:4-amino-4-deoxychorismate lyase